MTLPQRQPRVVVLGGGSWGTTVASICARRGPTLQWVRSEETANDINENHRNSRYLGNEVELALTLTRADVEAIRGVQCSEVLRQLMEKGLVRIAGRHDSLGRPVLYGTTKKFLQVFGFKSLRDLPPAPNLPPSSPPVATGGLDGGDEPQ